jgi:hypothetical protein
MRPKQQAGREQDDRPFHDVPALDSVAQGRFQAKDYSGPLSPSSHVRRRGASAPMGGWPVNSSLAHWDSYLK